MKRMLLLLAMGLVAMTIATACNKPDDTSSNMASTNAPMTNAAPAAGH